MHDLIASYFLGIVKLWWCNPFKLIERNRHVQDVFVVVIGCASHCTDRTQIIWNFVMSFQSLLSAMAVSLGVRQKVADPRTFASDDQVRRFDEEHALRLDSPRHIAGLDLMTQIGRASCRERV